MAPGIVEQPVETTVANGVSTTMGMVAGPSTGSFTWVDSATGYHIAAGSSFFAASSMDGQRIYCRIQNSYGYTLRNPVLFHWFAGSGHHQPAGEPDRGSGQPATFGVTRHRHASLSIPVHNGIS